MFRFSLRELLILMAFAAFAVVSMKYASGTWRTYVYAVMIVIFMWAAVAAVVDREYRQAFAIGMALCMAIYGCILLTGQGDRGNREFDEDDANLPTSRIARYFYSPTEITTWHDMNTGRVLPNYDPANPLAGTNAVRRNYRVPSDDVYMQIAHCWWALLLGYIGGRWAKFIYFRRESKSSPASR